MGSFIYLFIFWVTNNLIDGTKKYKQGNSQFSIPRELPLILSAADKVKKLLKYCNLVQK